MQTLSEPHLHFDSISVASPSSSGCLHNHNHIDTCTCSCNCNHCSLHSLTLAHPKVHTPDIAIDTLSVTSTSHRDMDRSDASMTSSPDAQSDFTSPQPDLMTPQSDYTSCDYVTDAQSPRPRADSFGFLRRKSSDQSGRSDATLFRKRTMSKKAVTRPIMAPRIPSEVLAQLDGIFPLSPLSPKNLNTHARSSYFNDPSLFHNRHQQHSAHASNQTLTMLAQSSAQSTAGTHEHEEAVDLNLMAGSMANRGR